MTAADDPTIDTNSEPRSLDDLPRVMLEKHFPMSPSPATPRMEDNQGFLDADYDERMARREGVQQTTETTPPEPDSFRFSVAGRKIVTLRADGMVTVAIDATRGELVEAIGYLARRSVSVPPTPTLEDIAAITETLGGEGRWEIAQYAEIIAACWQRMEERSHV